MPETAQRADPFVAFRFDLRFDENRSFGGFSECTGIHLETQVQDYLEGGRNDHAHKFPTRTVQTNVSLKRGIVDASVWQWYWELTQGNIATRNVTILVLSPGEDKASMEFRLRSAFPCKWSGPELNASQSNIAIETLELCHQGLERRK